MLVRLMVSWVHPQVMMFLGKVKNPTTDTMERNLDAARTLIDVLAELETKTEGRLEAEDQRLLKYTLTELRMNWLDESKKEAAAAAAPEAAPNSGAPESGASASTDTPDSPPTAAE